MFSPDQGSLSINAKQPHTQNGLDDVLICFLHTMSEYSQTNSVLTALCIVMILYCLRSRELEYLNFCNGLG
jgi:hypothetical protein